MNSSTKTIDIQVDGQPMAAALAEPQGAGRYPGVVVVMEAFGVNDYIREVAAELAGEGFIALAPDLYHRLGRLKTGGYDDFDGSRRMMATMRDDEVLEDVGAALDYLTELPNVQAGCLGLLGFWNGGRIAYLAACYRPDVKAVISFYGHIVYPETNEKRPVSPLDITDRLQAAALLLHGQGGEPMNLSEVEQIEARLRATGKTFESKIYDAPRGFHNPNAPAYREEAATDAWSRTLDWLRRYLA